MYFGILQNEILWLKIIGKKFLKSKPEINMYPGGKRKVVGTFPGRRLCSAYNPTYQTVLVNMRARAHTHVCRHTHTQQHTHMHTCRDWCSLVSLWKSPSHSDASFKQKLYYFLCYLINICKEVRGSEKRRSLGKLAKLLPSGPENRES